MRKRMQAATKAAGITTGWLVFYIFTAFAGIVFGIGVAAWYFTDKPSSDTPASISTFIGCAILMGILALLIVMPLTRARRRCTRPRSYWKNHQP